MMIMNSLLRSQRGSGLLVAMLALLALIAASTGAMVALVVAHSQRVVHQQSGLQALYLAEMAVEEALTRAAAGDLPPFIARTIYRPAEPGEVAAPSPDSPPAAGLGPQARPTPTVGSYQVQAHTAAGSLTLRAVGAVALPNGRLLTREVHVTCRRASGRWVAERWEQVP